MGMTGSDGVFFPELHEKSKTPNNPIIEYLMMFFIISGFKYGISLN